MLISRYTRYSSKWEILLLTFGAATSLLAVLGGRGIVALPVWVSAHINSVWATAMSVLGLVFVGRIVMLGWRSMRRGNCPLYAPVPAWWAAVAATVATLLQLQIEWDQRTGGMFRAYQHPVGWWERISCFAAMFQGNTYDRRDVASIIITGLFSGFCVVMARRVRAKRPRPVWRRPSLARIVIGVLVVVISTTGASSTQAAGESGSGGGGAGGGGGSTIYQIGENQGCSAGEISAAIHYAMRTSAARFGSGYNDDLKQLLGISEGTGFCYKAYDPVETPHGHAWGIPQALDGLYPATTTWEWRHSYRLQIRWGEDYIARRYGNPGAALEHENADGWY